MTDGIGLGATALAIAGIVFMAGKAPRRAALLGFFPLLFFGLMCAQRANFVRNMIPIIPYCAVFAASFANSLHERYAKNKVLLFVCGIWVACAIRMPEHGLKEILAEIQENHESRLRLETWAQSQSTREIAISQLRPDQQRALSPIRGRRYC